MLSGKRAILAGSFHYLKKPALLRLPLVVITQVKMPLNYAINLYPESSQEMFDDILYAFKIAENKKILMPVAIHTDFLLNNTKEVVETPSEKIIENLLGQFETKQLLKFEMPNNLESKAQLQKAAENTSTVITELNDEFKKRFKRTLSTAEKLMLDDAEFAFIVSGPDACNAKLAVKKLRENGEKVGLIRLHCQRPVPEMSLAHLKRIAVIDQEIFIGSSGLLHQEIKPFFFGFCSSFIVQTPSVKDYEKMFQRLKTAEKPEKIWMI
jgi:pyruvate/2-oxoacid:ferredoxin oxidoreductase alpha subunit